MSLLDAQTLTLAEVNSLTIEGASNLVLNEGYDGLQSSKLIFRNRLFSSRLFAPALFRGVGEEVEVAGIPASGILARTGPGSLKIRRTGIGAIILARSGPGSVKILEQPSP